MKIKLSIVVLLKNCINLIPNLVETIKKQDFPHEIQWIFMENSSTDGTAEFVENLQWKYKKVINVPNCEFCHSGTRMKGAMVADGEYIAFFTEDIFPIGKDYLKNLIKPLEETNVVATCGAWQINPETSDPVDAYLHNNWWQGRPDVIEPISQFYWDLITPQQRRFLCNFDDCSSCYKRDVLLELKLPDVSYGEDMLMAKRLILNGYYVAFSKDAKFYHWHHVSFSYFVKRMIIDQTISIDEFNIYYVRRKLGVLKTISIRALQRTFIAFFKLKIPIKKKFYWSAYALKLLTADFIGKYIGVLDENSIKGFSPINHRLLKYKEKIVKSIKKDSIGRY